MFLVRITDKNGSRSAEMDKNFQWVIHGFYDENIGTIDFVYNNDVMYAQPSYMMNYTSMLMIKPFY